MRYDPTVITEVITGNNNLEGFKLNKGSRKNILNPCIYYTEGPGKPGLPHASAGLIRR
jgi:hypothetical protein